MLEGTVVGGKAVFVFPGQGAQWERMAVELLDSAPVFAEEIAACGEALSRYVDWSLEDVLRSVPGAPSLERVDVVQPALFAVMVSLARLWQSYGVRPTAVLGHSQGEIAAAYVAGGLSLDDAARVVALRSRAVRDRLAGHGGMMSIALPVEQVEERIEPYGGRVSVAAVNGPATVVVSGEPDALDELQAACKAEEVRARRVSVDYASHSAQVETIEDELMELLAPIAPTSGQIPFYSTSKGEFTDTAELDADLLVPQPARARRLRAGGPRARGQRRELLHRDLPAPRPHDGRGRDDQARDAADRIEVIGSLRRDEGGSRAVRDVAGRRARGRRGGRLAGVLRRYRGAARGAADVRLPARAVLAHAGRPGAETRPRPDSYGWSIRCWPPRSRSVTGTNGCSPGVSRRRPSRGRRTTPCSAW